MPKLTDISAILAAATLALAFPAQAQTPAPATSGNTGWLIARNKEGLLVLSRKLDNLSIEYRAGAAGGADFLRVRARPCDEQTPNWVQDDDVTPTGDTAQDRRDSVSDAITDSVQNAGIACTLADDLEDRIMEGFEAAYTQFAKLKK